MLALTTLVATTQAAGMLVMPMLEATMLVCPPTTQDQCCVIEGWQLVSIL